MVIFNAMISAGYINPEERLVLEKRNHFIFPKINWWTNQSWKNQQQQDVLKETFEET